MQCVRHGACFRSHADALHQPGGSGVTGEAAGGHSPQTQLVEADPQCRVNGFCGVPLAPDAPLQAIAELGLVDRRRLTELALRPDTPELRTGILYSTIGCEVWLRSLDKGANHAAAR